MRFGTTVLLPRLAGFKRSLCRPVWNSFGNCQHGHRGFEANRKRIACCNPKETAPRSSDSFRMRYLILTHLRPFASRLQFRRSDWPSATSFIIFRHPVACADLLFLRVVQAAMVRLFELDLSVTCLLIFGPSIATILLRTRSALHPHHCVAKGSHAGIEHHRCCY